MWVLFDNLDKGWSAHGLTDQDVTILRCLIDAARKVQRQMQADDHDFHCVVFVRNDVYQLLVEASADYGKESRAVLDWHDPDLLREMLRKRLVHGVLPPDTPFDKVWNGVCVSHYAGEETSHFLIERSLMRPRNLIKLVSHCRGFAVGLEHEKIEVADIDKGLKSYSLDLITEADQELTDILGEDTNLLYHFIGEGTVFDRPKLERIVTGAGVVANKLDAAIEFLLYYGFFGIQDGITGPTFIYDVNYDMKLLSVLVTKAKEESKLHPKSRLSRRAKPLVGRVMETTADGSGGHQVSLSGHIIQNLCAALLAQCKQWVTLHINHEQKSSPFSTDWLCSGQHRRADACLAARAAKGRGLRPYLQREGHRRSGRP